MQKPVAAVNNDSLAVFILLQNEEAALLLAVQVSKLTEVNICRIYKDMEHLLFATTQYRTLIFADAQMLTQRNLQQIKQTLPNALLIATGNNIHLNENIHEHIFNYIDEPFVFGKIFSVINQAKLFYTTADATNTQTKKTFVLIKSEYKLIKINLADILFIAGMKDYIKIWVKDRTAPLTTLQNLKEFEKKLPQQDFIRVHKSYIVAFQHIDCIARNEIMIGNYSIPVGDSFRSGLNGFIETYL